MDNFEKKLNELEIQSQEIENKRKKLEEKIYNFEQHDIDVIEYLSL